MTSCPCCSTPMLRHVRQNKMYWFCRSCWQEMPLVAINLGVISASLEQQLVLQRSKKLLVAL